MLRFNNQYDTNCYDSYDFQTCLNLFRFKWFIWFSNMSKLVQIQYDTNCYDSIWYELLWFIWFSNMSKLVQIQYDMNCYDSIWFSNMSKLVLNCNMTKFCYIWVNGTKCKDKKENARTKRKMQGQKGKCKDDTKSDSLDCCEQVERSKTFLILYPWSWNSMTGNAIFYICINGHFWGQFYLGTTIITWKSIDFRDLLRGKQLLYKEIISPIYICLFLFAWTNSVNGHYVGVSTYVAYFPTNFTVFTILSKQDWKAS